MRHTVRVNWNTANLQCVEQGVEATFAVHGTEYTVICVTCQFGVSSGGSVDYALGTLDVKYTMAHELRDTGEFGFLLPADQGRCGRICSDFNVVLERTASEVHVCH